jgi:hypothetical protein
MPSLSKILNDQSYDLIDGPIRNHKPLQLWLKENGERAILHYDHLSMALKVPNIPVQTYPALAVNYSQVQEYSFNIGLTALSGLLNTLGLGSFGITAKFKSGRKVSISYDDSICRQCDSGIIDEVLSQADFLHENKKLYDQLNNDDILLIAGVLSAKNLLVKIETTSDISAEIKAELAQLANASIGFVYANSTTIEMKVSTGTEVPIAVYAFRLEYDRGEFVRKHTVTDNRNFF